jgi:hypothetical protein
MNSKKIMALLIVFAFAVSIIPMMQTQVKAQTAPSIKTYPESMLSQTQ